jgi:DNA-binding CsgD family transcriptional regulator
VRVALLLEEPQGRPPDPRAVAVAVLNVLRTLSEEAAVLIAVDDVQWLDTGTANVLAFAVRRIDVEPIGLLMTRRTEPGMPAAVGEDGWLEDLEAERLRLPPLQRQDLERLLDSRLGSPIPHAVIARIHQASGGNPFYALGIGQALVHSGASVDTVGELPLPERLHAVVAGSIAVLPEVTRDLLAVVAAADRPTLDLIGQVAGVDPAVVVRPAVISGVVAIENDGVVFTHPLRAVAARSGVSAERLRGIHARLSQLVSDPEQRARHLAMSVVGPDGTVALALEDAAVHARARGAFEVAADLADLAWRLTPDDRPEDAVRRKLAEARYLVRCGTYLERCRTLLEGVLAASRPGPDTAEAKCVLGWFYLTHHHWDRAATLLQEAIDESGERLDIRAIAEGALTAVLDLLGHDYHESIRHGYAELELAERLGSQAHMATALRGLARNIRRTTGHTPTDLLTRALGLERHVIEADTLVTQWPSVTVADLAVWDDEFDVAARHWARLLQAAEDYGEEISVIEFLGKIIPFEAVAGRWADAEAHARQGLELASAAGSVARLAWIVAGLSLLKAYRGDVAATRNAAEEASGLAQRSGAVAAQRLVAEALGLLAIALEDFRSADAHLGPLVASLRSAGVREPGELRSLPDAIEALARLGRPDEARQMLDWYQGIASNTGRASARAAALRCAAWVGLAEGDAAEAIVAAQSSVEMYDMIVDPLGPGRARLALGAAQRKAGHRRAARSALEGALAHFERHGSAAWVEAARRELSRISGRRSSGDELTTTEQEVSRLVAGGRTNREVAAAMFVSERTIEGHLSQIYAKLGVRSRSELVHRAGTADPTK